MIVFLSEAAGNYFKSSLSKGGNVWKELERQMLICPKIEQEFPESGIV